MTNEYIYFEFEGAKYRTNGSKVERLDGSTWNVTGSLRVVLAARNASKDFRINPNETEREREIRICQSPAGAL